jgi:hypothetical protein
MSQKLNFQLNYVSHSIHFALRGAEKTVTINLNLCNSLSTVLKRRISAVTAVGSLFLSLSI